MRSEATATSIQWALARARRQMLYATNGMGKWDRVIVHINEPQHLEPRICRK
jgi:hypothetical protein